jgi:hypothetical protein
MFEITDKGPRELTFLWYNSNKGRELVALFEPGWLDFAEQLAVERNKRVKSAAVTTLTFDGTISETRVDDGGQALVAEIDGPGAFVVQVRCCPAGKHPEWFRQLAKDQPVNVRIAFLSHETSKE